VIRVSGLDIYTLLRVLTLVVSVLPAYQDLRTRLIDDKVWFTYLLPYSLLVYGLFSGVVLYLDIIVGVLISIVIIVVMVVASKFGFSLGGADYIMFAVIAPLSFVFEPSIGGRRLIIPGFIQVLFLSSLISIFYVVLKCIYINRNRFGSARGLKSKLELLYGYWVESADELREIVVREEEGRKFVTPGIPMVSFIFLAMVILFVIDLII